MRPTKILLFLLLFSFCSTTETYRYELTLDDKIDEGLLTIDTTENSFINDSIVLAIQFFPKEPNSIDFYDLTFDMKFREDYESDFDGVCIGPTWNENKPGEIKITLRKDNNFKTNIDGKFNENSIEDDCSKYIYYLRYFESTADSGEIIKYGVATDYAENYPDAPNYWLVNKNNEIEKIGTTNIKKYSIKFELSK